MLVVLLLLMVNSIPWTVATSTPYAFDKKTPDLAQGLDFLRFWKGKPRETEEKTRKNLGTPGSKFLIIHFFLRNPNLRWKNVFF